MKTLILAALLVANALAECYAIGDIPDDPKGVANPRDARNGHYTERLPFALDIAAESNTGRLLRDKLAWIVQPFLIPPCVEFSTEVDIFDKPALTYVTFRRTDMQAGASERKALVLVYLTPHVTRVGIQSYMGRPDMFLRYYPGYELRHPGPSPVGWDLPGHPLANGQHGLIFGVSDAFDEKKWKKGQIHRQLDMHGDIIHYRAGYRVEGGFPTMFGRIGGTRVWYFKREGYSAQTWQPGDEVPSRESRLDAFRRGASR